MGGLNISQEVTPLRIDFKLETTFKEVSPLILVATFSNAPTEIVQIETIVIHLYFTIKH